MNLPAAVAAAGVNVGIELVGLAGVVHRFFPQALGVRLALRGLTAKPLCLNLGTLRLGLSHGRLGFALAGLEFGLLGFLANLGRLPPTLFLLSFNVRLPAFPAQRYHYSNHRQHDDDSNNDPDQLACLHCPFTFPVAFDVRGASFNVPEPDGLAAEAAEAAKTAGQLAQEVLRIDAELGEESRMLLGVDSVGKLGLGLARLVRVTL